MEGEWFNKDYELKEQPNSTAAMSKILSQGGKSKKDDPVENKKKEITEDQLIDLMVGYGEFEKDKPAVNKKLDEFCLPGGISITKEIRKDLFDITEQNSGEKRKQKLKQKFQELARVAACMNDLKDPIQQVDLTDPDARQAFIEKAVEEMRQATGDMNADESDATAEKNSMFKVESEMTKQVTEIVESAPDKSNLLEQLWEFLQKLFSGKLLDSTPEEEFDMKNVPNRIKPGG